MKSIASIGRIIAGAIIFAIATASANAQSFEPKTNVSIGENSLFDKGAPSGHSVLTIGAYDMTQGLVALYETPKGKRILFRSYFTLDGKVVARAMHVNPKNGKVEAIIDTSPAIASATTNTIFAAGVDLLGTLSDSRKDKKFDNVRQSRLKVLLRDESGEAIVDGIAALYMQLESMETSKALTKLKVPFGVVRTSLELVTGDYRGIEHLVKEVGFLRAESLRTACADGKCLYRTKQFIVQRSGLFDVISAVSTRTKRPINSVCANLKPNSSQVRGNNTINTFGDGDDDCFGMCGPGCFTPGDIWTPECDGHDTCVDRYGHFSCIFDVPEECEDCNTLVDALVSWIYALIR